MRFMNNWEIDEARDRWGEHPVLGPATRTLLALRDCADQNSDGWAYWPKPARSAAKLMALIDGDESGLSPWEARFGDREDATVEKLKAAYRPIKAFRTRSGLDFHIYDPEEALF